MTLVGDPCYLHCAGTLQARNIQLPGAIFKTPHDQAQRFSAAGFPDAKGVSLKQIRHQAIPKQELERISKLEMLDEVEELELLLDHYCIAWATTGPGMEAVTLD